MTPAAGASVGERRAGVGRAGVHAVPALGHRHELVLAEVAEEALADAGEVGRPRVGEQLVALVGQDREAAAPVGRAVSRTSSPSRSRRSTSRVTPERESSTLSASSAIRSRRPGAARR